MKQFDIIRYMSTMTGYTFGDDVLERIALERGVRDCDDMSELTERDKDLLLADMLMVIYTTPTETSALEKKHGAWEQRIGSQRMTDKRHIYELMMRLYRKWDDPKAEMMDQGGLQWLE